MLWCPSLPYNYNLTLSFSLSSTVIVGSRLWPYAAGCVRNYAVATEQKDEGSIAVRSKQAQQFDWALSKLDSSVRRTGRITRTLLLRIFHDVSRAGYPSGNQALLLLRSCGSLLPEVPLEERTELAHRVWEKLQELGAQYDASHYNALLKVYLQNEFKFSPTDFLAKMEAANVQPNRVTYQRLIAAYCQTGDIEGASTILGFMKNKDLPITEAVFSSLVTGHARAGDIESAKNILPVMRGAGIEPTPDTYVALLIAYAEKGDMDNLKTTLEAAESADCSLMDRDIMQVIFALAKAGHQQHIPEMIERLRHERGFVPDAMNLCLSLITQGQEDTAFLILMAFPTLQSDNFNDPNLGNFFLRHCISMDTSLEKLIRYCKGLQESSLHSSPLSFTLYCALEAKKTGTALELMKLFKEQELPVRPHYFWPLLVQHGKEDNAAGVVEVMKSMQELGVSPDVETFSNYVLPVFPSREAAQQLFFLVPAVICVVKSICVKFLFLFFQITELLYKDERFSKEGIKPAAFFLYNLMDNMTEGQVQAQEDKLRSFFNQLHTQNITISMNLFRGIKNILVSYHIPELCIVMCLTPLCVRQGIGTKVLALENRLAELKAENKPLNIVLKQIIQTLSAEENLQRALELKQQHEQDMTVGAYATLINLCCRHNNVDEALNLKRELSRMDSSIALDTSKYITLVKALALNDRAVDILKEMKEKNVVMNDNSITTIFHMLNAVAAKGGAGSIRRLQDTIFTLGLAKPTANLCSPVVTAYLDSNDVPGALEAALECQKRYNHLPRIHDIIVALVERGDTDLLQKAMDFVSQERGEMIMLYDLFFAFLQTGRYREARKIIETPGLRAKPGRLQWYSEKCIVNNQMEALEQMVEMTSKLFECDRDDMYSYVLRLCKDTNNWQKAEAMWTKMQEENVIPRERTLHLLADILKSNGQEVPFEVPEVKPHKKMFSLPVSAESRVPGFKLTDVANSMFIITYSKKDQVKDALEKLKSMLQLDHVPSHLAITRLVQALGNHGDVAGIQQVESQIQSLGTRLNLSSMVFVNNTALAHIKNGDVESAVELLEGIYTSPDSTSPSMSFVFRKVLEGGNDRALDKLSAMAERLANHFACYRPASDLFLQLLDMDKVEDAKFMLARCNAVAEQKEVLLSFVAQKAQVPGQVTSLILDKDLTSAKALYEQMQKEGIVVDELSLKRLAVLYRNAGETAPFPEPPVRELCQFYTSKVKRNSINYPCDVISSWKMENILSF
uniref:PROP1-like PPR domain-containing protein n=1 Tax=Amphiprion ocellaris TaxID=80972 RepID=A0AAQ6AE64_AMPOC